MCARLWLNATIGAEVRGTRAVSDQYVASVSGTNRLGQLAQGHEQVRAPGGDGSGRAA